jgi:hypothetical protein
MATQPCHFFIGTQAALFPNIVYEYLTATNYIETDGVTLKSEKG